MLVVVLVLENPYNIGEGQVKYNIGEGQVKYRKKRVFYATLLSFVLYSLPHSHEVPARQG